MFLMMILFKFIYEKIHSYNIISSSELPCEFYRMYFLHSVIFNSSMITYSKFNTSFINLNIIICFTKSCSCIIFTVTAL